MSPPIYAALAAGVIILLQIVLMLSVGLHRNRSGVTIGIGEDADLERKVRRHGNLAENAGIFIAALALGEMVGVSSTVVATLGGIFVVGRLLHAIGFASLAGSHFGEGSKAFVAARGLGAFSTLISSVGTGVAVLYTVSSLI